MMSRGLSGLDPGDLCAEQAVALPQGSQIFRGEPPAPQECRTREGDMSVGSELWPPGPRTLLHDPLTPESESEDRLLTSRGASVRAP